MELNDNVEQLFNLLREKNQEEFIRLSESISNFDWDIRDNNGHFLIQLAVVFNLENVVKKLLTFDVKVDFIDQEGKTLLYYPIKYGYINLINILLEYDKTIIGVSLLENVDINGHIPLHYTVQYNNINLFQEIYNRYPKSINTKNNQGISPFLLAIIMSRADIINFCLKSPIVDLTQTNNFGETCIHLLINNASTLQTTNDIINVVLDKDETIVDIPENEMMSSPLMYAIANQNYGIFKLLVNKSKKWHLQDVLGNTFLHYLILEQKWQIINALDFTNYKPILGIMNLEGQTPLHLIIELYNYHNISFDLLRMMIKESNINRPNSSNVTIVDLLDKIESKELDIITELNEKEYYNYELVQNVKFKRFLIESYKHQLRTKDKAMFSRESDKKILVDKVSDNEIVKTIMAQKSAIVLVNQNHKELLKLDRLPDAESTRFTGLTIDVLSGMLYLKQKHHATCQTLTLIDGSYSLLSNEMLETFIKTIGKSIYLRGEFLNIELLWINYKLFFPTNFDLYFQKLLKNSNCHYIMIPLGIDIAAGGHSNMLILDVQNGELERFEPYGAYPPINYNYYPTVLDSQIEMYFKRLLPKLKYIPPSQFLPSLGFQSIETYSSYKCKRIGDPEGFCAAWSLWWADNRIKNSHINRKELSEKLIDQIRQENISFKSVIRNYSKLIADFRDSYLDKLKLNINDFINDTFSDKQIQELENVFKTEFTK